MDEFDEVLALLLDHRASPSAEGERVARRIAAATMLGNHLWQDMKLTNRTELSQLIQNHFPSLAARNANNMKWKKFFYRQLCERAGVPVCKSPHCAECRDHALCFGPES